MHQIKYQLVFRCANTKSENFPKQLSNSPTNFSSESFEITFEGIIHHNLHGTLQRNQGEISTFNNNITEHKHFSTKNPIREGMRRGNFLSRVDLRAPHERTNTLVENKLTNAKAVQTAASLLVLPHHELLTNKAHGVGMKDSGRG